MTKVYSVKVRIQVYLTALLIVIVALFNFLAFNVIDSLAAGAVEDQQNNQRPGSLSTDQTSRKSSEAQAFTFSRQFQNKKTTFLGISLLILCSAFLILHFVLRKLALPIARIKDGLDKVCKGDLSFRIKAKGNDEFSHLAQVFNNMSRQLEAMMGEVEAAQRDLENQVLERTRALADSNKKLERAMVELKGTQKHTILKETQKSLTTIVSGFGHEINNPLTGILGSVELIQLKEDLTPYFQQKINVIKKESLRIKAIIEELNQLNPELDQTKFHINLVNLLEKLVKIMRRRKENKGIRFITDLPPDPIIVRGNHSALWQVFEGVVRNSVEAIADRDVREGRIRVKLVLSENMDNVICTITDNGGGFKDTEKAFDPFYTTKSRVIKKGIGLSIALNLLREHRGTIEIANTESGARLVITLPLHWDPDKIRNKKNRLIEA